MSRLEVPIASGSLLKLYQAQWGPIYEAVLAILGSTGTILPIGDPHHGQPNATTFKTVGEEQVTFTWSEAPSAFDTALDLTNPARWQGIVPVVEFNGTDEEADSPDAAYWSRVDTGAVPVSMGAWVHITDSAAVRAIMAKWATSNQEWQFRIQADDFLRLIASDQSAGFNVTRTTDAVITPAVWKHLVMTYDGAGGASAMDTVELLETPADVVERLAIYLAVREAHETGGALDIAEDHRGP